MRTVKPTVGEDARHKTEKEKRHEDNILSWEH